MTTTLPCVLAEPGHPWMPPPPGSLSSMPAGHPEGPLVLTPTELAALTFVLAGELDRS